MYIFCNAAFLNFGPDSSQSSVMARSEDVHIYIYGMRKVRPEGARGVVGTRKRKGSNESTPLFSPYLGLRRLRDDWGQVRL